MSRKYIILISFVVVAAVIGLLALRWVYKPAATSVDAEKADVVISAGDLVNQFETDETAANKSYLDKIVLVTGTIESVSEDQTVITVSLKNPGDLSGVLCSFDNTTLKKEDFITGKQIKVKGICTGYLMDVVLTKCSLVK